MNAPVDHDGESFCTVDGCHNPATHQAVTGMVADTPVFELICCTHANKEDQ